jgi:Spy/CpxP family protein refolding chaperone
MKPSAIVSLSLFSAGLALSASQGGADEPAIPPAPPVAPGNPPATPGEGSEPTPTPPPTQHRGHTRPGYVLSELAEKLNLTPDQKKTIGAIIKDSQGQMQAVRGDDSLSRDDKRAKVREVMASTREQIRAALTPDQQKQFDAMPPPGPGRPKNPDNN